MGGAPARYDGGLSYILDLRTRSPRRDRLRGGGALDLMSGQASLEGPLGPRASLLVAGRALHDGAAPLWGGTGSPYGYADGLLRFDTQPAPGHRVGVTGFANQESVFLDLVSTLGLIGPDAARWGNRALSLVYEGGAGGTQLDATAAGSRYRAELPVPPSALEQAAGSTDPTLARGRTNRLRLALDATRPFAGGTIRFGGSVDRTVVSYGAHRLTGPSSTATDASTAGSVAGGYLDLTAGASASVSVRAGLRGRPIFVGQAAPLGAAPLGALEPLGCGAPDPRGGALSPVRTRQRRPNGARSGGVRRRAGAVSGRPRRSSSGSPPRTTWCSPSTNC